MALFSKTKTKGAPSDNQLSDNHSFSRSIDSAVRRMGERLIILRSVGRLSNKALLIGYSFAIADNSINSHGNSVDTSFGYQRYRWLVASVRARVWVIVRFAFGLSWYIVSVEVVQRLASGAHAAVAAGVVGLLQASL